MMKISIFGLGYVGCVSGACIAGLGHKVIGVDPNNLKVDMINGYKSPIIEEKIRELIEDVVKKGMFVATTDWAKAIKESDVAMICVGTPSKSNGSIDLVYVKRVSEQIAKALKQREEYFVVCVRSTVFPGTVEGTIIPILEEYSGKVAGKDFGVCMIPEFLREGSSVYDFYHPPKSVIGELDKKSGDRIVELFNQIEAPLIRTKIKVAEMVKYTDNSFHALKITFANEIGNICKELEIDSHRVMDIFCKDIKLNLSSYYLKPGFAFGGSCLPKDLRAINYESKMLNIDIPILSTILESNKRQIHKVIKLLMEYKGSSLGFFGLSFKGGTDDLRESPLVEVIETMIGKGFKVKIYDNNVSLARLFGSNKEYIEKEIPHISSLMCSSAKYLINNSDIIIVGNFDKEYKEALLEEVKENQTVIDLSRIIEDSTELKCRYYGVCW
jgi:GDP-mannose 6-dehydrogenase